MLMKRWDVSKEKMMKKSEERERAQAALKDICELMYNITNYVPPRN